MHDKKLKLPGSETVTLPGSTIDKLVRTGDGDAALLYLYILRTNGQCTTEEAAVALGKGTGVIATEMATLSRLGLVIFDDDTGTPPPYTQNETTNVTSSRQPLEEPRQYTIDEMKAELNPGSGFSIVVDETQRRLGKILSPDDLMRLFGIYDSLRLPPEVIMQLITHCISECHRSGSGQAPSLRYIEKAAYTWEREGVFSLERAEEYLKALEARRSEQGKIKKALQIKDREFSATERRYVDSWIDMGFRADAIEIAFDRTVLKTGSLSWGYIDSIIKSWHGKNLHTPQEIQDKDGKKNSSKPVAAGTGSPASGHSAPSLEDIERMEQLLKKTKEE